MNERISKLYEEEESRGFFFHLVKSYLQEGKTRKVLDFNEHQKKRCALCDAKLISLNDVMSALEKNQGENAMRMALLPFKSASAGVIAEEHNSNIRKMFDGRVLGHTAENTNTCLCSNCVEDLLAHVSAQCLEGNKEISNVVSGMMRKQRYEAEEAKLTPDQKCTRDGEREARRIKFGGTKLEGNSALLAMKAALTGKK